MAKQGKSAPDYRFEQIASVGVSHRSTSLELLEEIAIPAEELAGRLKSLAEQDCVAECVVLSTCHRVEVYVRSAEPQRAVAAALDVVLGAGGVPRAEFEAAIVVRQEQETVEHLFAVTAGLKSVVVGEEQIVAQVRDAMRLAAEHGAMGPVLAGMFQSALRVSKRARTETELGKASSSLVGVGMRRAAEVLGDLRDRTAVINGAGRMGLLAGQLLRDAGVRAIVVTSRTEQHAHRLAEQIWGVPIRADGLVGAMAEADLVVSSTAAPGFVLTGEQVAAAMRDRPNRPLFLLDLAMPRDIDPAAAATAGVTLTDLDGLRTWLCEQGERDDIEAAWRLVTQGVEEFRIRRSTTGVVPVIGALRAQAAHLVDLEVRRLHHRLPELDQQTRQETGAAVRRAIGKLLHTPTVRMKELSDGPDGQAYAKALITLFDLDLDHTGTAP